MGNVPLFKKCALQGEGSLKSGMGFLRLDTFKTQLALAGYSKLQTLTQKSQKNVDSICILCDTLVVQESLEKDPKSWGRLMGWGWWNRQLGGPTAIWNIYISIYIYLSI